MEVFVFLGRGNNYGFATDAQFLPSSLGPWEKSRKINLQRGQKRTALDVETAIDELETKGYYVTQAEVSFNEIPSS